MGGNYRINNDFVSPRPRNAREELGAKRQELAVGCILFDVMTACMLASKVNYGTVVVKSCHFAMVVKVWTLFG